MSETVLQGNCIDVLKTLPDKSVQCCVTSPPYYALRDYGTGRWVGGDPNCPHRRLSKFSEKTITGRAQAELRGNVGDAIYKTVCPLCGAVRIDEQIGLEETPEEYVAKLTAIFHEVKRVLKDDGTLWLNIGDSYCGTGDKGDWKDPKYPDGRNGQTVSRNRNLAGVKHKDLIGIPWMLAFSLRADGWYLRQDIIWAKPNPMPESVKDRCTKSHEYIFLLTKEPQYYYNADAIRDPIKEISLKRAEYGWHGKGDDGQGNYAGLGQTDKMGTRFANPNGINKRDVWMISPKPYAGAHFATFPEALVEPCILAGSRGGDTVLDPFNGAATTGVVCIKNKRNYIGVELNPEYVKLSEERLKKTHLENDLRLNQINLFEDLNSSEDENQYKMDL